MAAILRLSQAASSGVFLPPRPGATATTRRSAAARFLLTPVPGKKGTGTKNLSLLCRSDPEDKWWVPQLRPEDLVEPTGKGAEEVKAIRDAMVLDPLQPICLALREIVATRGNILRCRCFHAGIVSGALLLVAGLCQLYKVAPNLSVDIVLAYIFYRLSVLAADLKRNGKDNTICARIQCAIMVILFHKCKHPTKDLYYYLTKHLWTFSSEVYSCTVLYELCGIKYPRQSLEAFCKKVLKTIGDLAEGLKSSILDDW
ncbi:hypothetical protein U9M48_037178 [Paspalum notatum var. saurae]|uniref:Uncharacterized protein n=1 Tax=Paspalum notatum var. saurae TaxID=547442 RepID=A0AAQ3XAT1_PASNO